MTLLKVIVVGRGFILVGRSIVVSFLPPLPIPFGRTLLNRCDIELQIHSGDEIFQLAKGKVSISLGRRVVETRLHPIHTLWGSWAAYINLDLVAGEAGQVRRYSEQMKRKLLRSLLILPGEKIRLTHGIKKR